MPDDRLRLMFTCCHPALARRGARRAHAAHARRAVGAGGRARVPRRRARDGEAARARQAQDRRCRHRLPRAARSDELPHRLPSVLAAVYLIFNEGYAATAGEALVRRELCAEAIRLGRLLVELMPGEPEPRGLLALMLLHHARRDARVDAEGRLVLLADQDRALWTRDEIEEGRALAARAPARRPLRRCRRRSPPSTSRAADRLGADRRALRAARRARPEPGDRAQPRGRGRDGRRAGARARADRRDRRASTATTCCTPRAPTCCAGWARARTRAPPTSARSSSPPTRSSATFLERRLREA